MDRRQKKTREAIFIAFNHLLTIKDYNKITIQEIIDLANIGRSTFYSHFETKDALLNELCLDLFTHIFSDNLVKEKSHDFSFSDDNSEILITHILYHLKDNKKNISGLLLSESSELFLHFFKQYLNDLFFDQLFSNVDRKNKAVPDAFLLNHITGSFIEMIRWWLKNNLKQSPEELTSYFISVIFPII
ncbi:TetR/AcrR family transcriptional regulator [Enterococcus sp. DIV0086]|uniref:TetR/AcrR family transcriptional regulator n=1 Tax=Enterococcus sp. DIV0086 TaxID=2774655 RepID=UPI003D290061